MATLSADSIIEDILRREGGFIDDPDDLGGVTNHGITLRTLSEVRGRPVGREDVMALDINEAREILREQNYRAPGIDRLPAALQPFLTDCAVNHGPRAAIRMLQSVLAAVGAEAPAIDGRLGPETARLSETETRRLGPALLRSLVEERRRLYYRIVAKRPQSGKFLSGWLRRADEFEPQKEWIS